jgi:hypothetical protein
MSFGIDGNLQGTGRSVDTNITYALFVPDVTANAWRQLELPSCTRLDGTAWDSQSSCRRQKLLLSIVRAVRYR